MLLMFARCSSLSVNQPPPRLSLFILCRFTKYLYLYTLSSIDHRWCFLPVREAVTSFDRNGSYHPQTHTHPAYVFYTHNMSALAFHSVGGRMPITRHHWISLVSPLSEAPSVIIDIRLGLCFRLLPRHASVIVAGVLSWTGKRSIPST